MSGMTLGFSKDADGQPTTARLYDISDGPGSYLGYVDLKMAKKEGGEINSESFINICIGNYVLDLDNEEEDEEL